MSVVQYGSGSDLVAGRRSARISRNESSASGHFGRTTGSGAAAASGGGQYRWTVEPWLSKEVESKTIGLLGAGWMLVGSFSAIYLNGIAFQSVKR